MFGLLAKIIGYVFLFLVYIIVLGFVRSWAFVNLYDLFVVPVYHLPALTFLQAYGLIIIYNFFTVKTKLQKADTERDMMKLLNIASTKFFVDILSSIFVVYLSRFIAKFL